MLQDYTAIFVSQIFTKEEKDFKHFHFTAWPERGMPENADSILHFRDIVNQAEDVRDGPVLVHCRYEDHYVSEFNFE